MKDLDILTGLGLSKQEAAIYIACLRLGSAEASNIAKEAGFQRTAAYPVLKKLAQKGFVSVFYKGGRRLYNAQKPAKLARYYQNKLEAFTNFIPRLEALDKKQASAFGLRFIETKEELENFYRDVIEKYKGKEYFVIGSTPNWEGLNPEFFVQFRKDRARAKIKTKLLLSEDSKEMSPVGPGLLRHVKFLPPKYTFRSTIDIYPDQILIVSPEMSSLAVVIAVSAMVDVFRSVFDILWENIA